MYSGISTDKRSGKQLVNETDELFLAFLDSATHDKPEEIGYATFRLLNDATRLPLGLCAEVGRIASPTPYVRPVEPTTRLLKPAQLGLNPYARAETIADVTAYVVASEHSRILWSDSRRYALAALDQGSVILGSLNEQTGSCGGRSAMSELICERLDAYFDYFEGRAAQPPAENHLGWLTLAQATEGMAEFIWQASMPAGQS